jgi:transposase InsO family protein
MMKTPYVEQPKNVRELIEMKYEAITPLVEKHDRGEPITREDWKRRSQECKEKGWTGCSPSSLYRNFKRYLENYDKADLAPRKRSKGLERKSLWFDDVQAFVDYIMIKQDYLGRRIEIPDVLKHIPFLEPKVIPLNLSPRAKLKFIYDLRTASLDDPEASLWPFPNIDPPSYWTVERRLKAITSKFERVAAREGKKVAQNLYGREYSYHSGALGIVDVTLPNELWEIDNTYADLIVKDEKGRNLGRVYLTAIVDVATRAIVGFSLDFRKPSYIITQRAMINAMMPKDKLLERLGIEWGPDKTIKNHPWPMGGIPARIMIDNGKEYINENFITACVANNINLVVSKVKTPEWKALVERVFKTLNLRVIHNIKGTTFSNVQDKGDYNPEKNTWATFQRLEKLIVLGICEHNASKQRRFKKVIPNQLWAEKTKTCPPRLPLRKKQLRQLRISFLPFEERAIRRRGIQNKDRFYWSEELRPYIKSGSKVRFYEDPLNIDRGFVYIDEIGDYVEVKRLQQYPQNEIIDNFGVDRALAEWEFDFAVDLWKKKFNRKPSSNEIAALKNLFQKTLAETDDLTLKYRRLKEQMMVDALNREIDDELLGPSTLPKLQDSPKTRPKKKSKSRPSVSKPTSLIEVWDAKQEEREQVVEF